MESYNRHHEIIQLSTLVMVISLMLPMAICIDTNLDYVRTAWLMFSICMGIACAVRIPYKMGKINKYAPKKEKDPWDSFFEQLDQKLKSRLYEEIKKESNKNFYNPSQSQAKTTNDWRLPYLKVLGLDASATNEQVKSTYRKLAMKWHPDRNKAANAEETFKKIKSAYESLC
jgi:hypothetical protein